MQKRAQSAGAVQYTDCITVEGQNPANEYPGYDMKQSDVVAPVMLELWGMWSSPSWLLLPGSLWLWVVASNRALSIGQIELFDI